MDNSRVAGFTMLEVIAALGILVVASSSVLLVVDRCLASASDSALRMAAFELRFLKDAPKQVVLNEAIEIARHYGAEDSWAFINGILDKLAEDVEEGQNGG